MRLFVAVNLPAALRDALWTAADPVRGATVPVRWVRPEGIHVTLKFLGEVLEERAAELGAALDRAVAGVRAFDLIVEGGGVFPGPAAPRVFWAGVVPDPQLELLQHAVERELAPLGFPTEGRPFRPHVTLGRAKRGGDVGALTRAAERIAGVPFAGDARIETVDLMRSTPSAHGATYDAVHRAALG